MLARVHSLLFRLPAARFFTDLLPAELLVKQWWSMPAFGLHSKLVQPVLSFKTGELVGRDVTLSNDVFGQPLRRDLIHNVFIYNRKLGWLSTHRSKRRGEVEGSPRKMRPQKKSGQARAGSKRNPHWRGGGHSHGPILRDRSIEMNKKVVLKGLCAMLSARVAEGKLQVVDDILQDAQKTKQVAEVLKRFESVNRVLLIHDTYPTGFLQAARNLDKLFALTHKEIDVKVLLKSEAVLITEAGLKTLQAHFEESRKRLYRYKRLPVALEAPTPIEPVVIKTPMLKDIVSKYDLKIPTA